MKESLLIAKKLYKDIFDKPLQVYNKFVEFFGINYVDIQDLPRFKDFCDYLYKNVDYLFANLNIYQIDNFNILDFTFKEYNKLVDNNKIFTLISTIINNHYINSDFYIYVHWPEVKITNEYDQSTIIKDLYFKTNVDIDGKLKQNSILLNRSTYSKKEVLKDYLHSHIPGIDSNYEFLHGCTGRGPIGNTMCYLCNNYDLEIYGLFCQELDNYVKTESIKGVPYRRLSELDQKTSSNKDPYNKLIYSYNYSYLQHINEHYRDLIFNEIRKNKLFFKSFFLKFFKEFKIPFAYRNNMLQIGISINDFALQFNDYFIKYLNCCYDGIVEEFINNKFLSEITIQNNAIYLVDNESNYNEKLMQMIHDESNNLVLFKFKNKNVYLHVIKEKKEDKKRLYAVHPYFIAVLLSLITGYINIKYYYNDGDFTKSKTEYCTSRFAEDFKFL